MALYNCCRGHWNPKTSHNSDKNRWWHAREPHRLDGSPSVYRADLGLHPGFRCLGVSKDNSVNEIRCAGMLQSPHRRDGSLRVLAERNSGYLQLCVFSRCVKTALSKIVDGMLQSPIAEMDLLECLPSRFRFQPDVRFLGFLFNGELFWVSRVYPQGESYMRSFPTMDIDKYLSNLEDSIFPLLIYSKKFHQGLLPKLSWYPTSLDNLPKLLTGLIMRVSSMPSR